MDLLTKKKTQKKKIIRFILLLFSLKNIVCNSFDNYLIFLKKNHFTKL